MKRLSACIAICLIAIGISAGFAADSQTAPPLFRVTPRGQMLQQRGGVPVSGVVLFEPLSQPAPRRNHLDDVGTNVRCNQDAIGHQQNEMTIGTSPANMNNVLSGSNDYRNGDASAGFYRSTNGGTIWADALITRGPAGTFEGAGDPVASVDAAGRMYVTYIAFDRTTPDNGLYVQTSTDNGTTWSSAAGIVQHTGGGSADFEDKPYACCDYSTGSPYLNNMYVTWTKFPAAGGAQINLSRSTNGGATFSAPMAISTSTNTQFSCPTVGPNGEVYVVWDDFSSGNIKFDRSTNGGVTFGTDITVSSFNDAFPTPACGTWRSDSYPVITCDVSSGPRRGWLYVSWADARNGNPDIYFCRSTNGGTSWSAAQRIDTDTNGRWQWFNWLSCNPSTGEIGACWLDTREDAANCQYKEYGTVSADGGTTWTANFAIASVASNPSGSSFIGDYGGASFRSTGFFGAWTDLRNDAGDDYSAWFTGTNTPWITVAAPNGGETWYAGESHAMTWSSAYLTGKVKIELSRNYNPSGGSTWVTLLDSTANDGTESWLVTTPATTTARIRITSVTTPAIGDTSNANFTIALPWVTVTSPNGGEAWVTFENRAITWQSAGFTDSVKIELTRSYQTSGGSTWETLAASTSNDGSFTWAVTGAAAAGRIRIGRASDPAIADTSNTNFTITTPTISVTSPNTAVTWYTGESRAITWSAALLTGNVKIELARSYNPAGGSTWDLLFDNTSNDGTESWLVSGATTTAARVRISSDSYPSVADTSNVNFTIAAPFITVSVPNGGESWTIGSGQNITWSSGGVPGNVLIEVNRAYAVGIWDTLFASTLNDGSQAWTVTGPATAQARVRITSVSTPSITDISDANFTIQSPPPVLVHDPLGDLATGTGTVTVMATSPQSSIASVKMLYRLAGATFFDSLTLNSTGNPNEFAHVLSMLAVGSYQYSVRATDMMGISSSLPANAPAGLYAFDVGVVCGTSLVYDDGSADKFSWSEGTPGVATRWAVKFGPVTTPYVICAAQFAASRSLPDAAHTPIHLYVYAADGSGGLPGTLLQDAVTGSVGNVIGGLPTGTNWALALLRDDLGGALILNNAEFYIAVGNDSVGKYEAFGRDTTGTNSHRAYFYDPCETSWFSEDAIGNSNAHPGNRMIRVNGYPLAAPAVVIYLTADTLRLAWSNAHAPSYSVYAASDAAGGYSFVQSTADTFFTVGAVDAAATRMYYQVQTATAP